VIYTDANNQQSQRVYCQSVYFEIVQRAYDVKITPGTWHTLRIELYPDTMTFTYLLDGKTVGGYNPRNADKLKNLDFSFVANVNAGTDPNRSVTGYADYVRMGKIEESEMKPTAYRWDFDVDPQGWDKDFANVSPPTSIDGSLQFTTTEGNPGIISPGSLQISSTATPIITVRMRVQTNYQLVGKIYFVTNKDGNWDEKKRKIFSVRTNEQMETYDIDMSTVSTWQGVITQIRVDPLDNVFAGIQITIDYISVHAP
jgi:hypothetical protein